MPEMPSYYSDDLINLIKSMLQRDTDKRPSVNRILREPYIRKYFLPLPDKLCLIMQARYVRALITGIVYFCSRTSSTSPTASSEIEYWVR